jgi:hypothetical protein
MPLTITTINIKDTITTFRNSLNNNFAAVKVVTDALEEKIDTANSTITIQNITLSKEERATSTEIFTVEASGRINGNFVIDGTTTTNDVNVATNSNITVNSGNVNVSGTDSNFNLEGDLYLERNIIHKDYADSSIDASLTTNYTSVDSNVGLLDVSNKHAMILDFSNYSSSGDVENINDVNQIKLSQGQFVGQNLTLVINANASSGKPHKIVDANISTLGSGEFISTSSDYAVVDLVYVGTAWVVKSLFNAVVE